MKFDFLPINLEWLTDYCKIALFKRNLWQVASKVWNSGKDEKKTPLLHWFPPQINVCVKFARELWAIYCIICCFLSLYPKTPVVPFIFKIQGIFCTWNVIEWMHQWNTGKTLSLDSSVLPYFIASWSIGFMAPKFMGTYFYGKAQWHVLHAPSSSLSVSSLDSQLCRVWISLVV